jgi:hypothetical protein
MSSNWRAFSLMCGVCAVALACDGRAPGPVAPAAASAVSLTRAGAGPARARGHVDIHGTEVQNVRDQTYSFTAVSTDAPPLAKGQVEVHTLRFTGEELVVHAEVTCLSVVGDQAWIGSRVTRFVVDGQEMPARVGGPMIFRVRDVGENHDAVDLASLVFFGVPSELTYCNTRPAFPILFPSTIGNIQVTE